MCVLSIKVPIRKKSGNLFNDAHLFSSHVSNNLETAGTLNDNRLIYTFIQSRFMFFFFINKKKLLKNFINFSKSILYTKLMLRKYLCQHQVLLVA